MANLKDVITFCKGLVGSCKSYADLKAKIGAEFGARDLSSRVIDNMHDRWNTHGTGPRAITEVFESIGTGKPVATFPRDVASASVPMPAAKVAIAPKPAPLVTAESIGKAVIATTTHPDPKISKPARAHLEGLTGLARVAASFKHDREAREAKAARPAMPDISALHGTQAVRAVFEWKHTGKFSDETEKLLAYRNSQKTKK